jgi:OOP family OmpA-OmpF porin
MNKVILFSTIALSASIASFAAHAAETDNPSGFYAGVGWGQFNLDIDDLGDAGSAIEDIAESDDNAWKVFGGYRVNPYLAFEAAYIDFGEPGDNFETAGTRGNYTADISGFAPYVIGTLPLGPVELFGKVGYYFYDVDVRVDLDDPGPDFSSSSSEQDFLYGGGVGVTIAERLHLRAEYEVVDLENADEAEAMWLSAAWRF